MFRVGDEVRISSSSPILSYSSFAGKCGIVLKPGLSPHLVRVQWPDALSSYSYWSQELEPYLSVGDRVEILGGFATGKRGTIDKISGTQYLVGICYYQAEQLRRCSVQAANDDSPAKQTDTALSQCKFAFGDRVKMSRLNPSSRGDEVGTVNRIEPSAMNGGKARIYVKWPSHIWPDKNGNCWWAWPEYLVHVDDKPTQDKADDAVLFFCPGDVVKLPIAYSSSSEGKINTGTVVPIPPNRSNQYVWVQVGERTFPYYPNQLTKTEPAKPEPAKPEYNAQSFFVPGTVFVPGTRVRHLSTKDIGTVVTVPDGKSPIWVWVHWDNSADGDSGGYAPVNIIRLPVQEEEKETQQSQFNVGDYVKPLVATMHKDQIGKVSRIELAGTVAERVYVNWPEKNGNFKDEKSYWFCSPNQLAKCDVVNFAPESDKCAIGSDSFGLGDQVRRNSDGTIGIVTNVPTEKHRVWVKWAGSNQAWSEPTRNLCLIAKAGCLFVPGERVRHVQTGKVGTVEEPLQGTDSNRVWVKWDEYPKSYSYAPDRLEVEKLDKPPAEITVGFVPGQRVRHVTKTALKTGTVVIPMDGRADKVWVRWDGFTMAAPSMAAELSVVGNVSNYVKDLIPTIVLPTSKYSEEEQDEDCTCECHDGCYYSQRQHHSCNGNCTACPDHEDCEHQDEYDHDNYNDDYVQCTKCHCGCHIVCEDCECADELSHFEQCFVPGDRVKLDLPEIITAHNAVGNTWTSRLLSNSDKEATVIAIPPDQHADTSSIFVHPDGWSSDCWTTARTGQLTKIFEPLVPGDRVYVTFPTDPAKELNNAGTVIAIPSSQRDMPIGNSIYVQLDGYTARWSRYQRHQLSKFEPAKSRSEERPPVPLLVGDWVKVIDTHSALIGQIGCITAMSAAKIPIISYLDLSTIHGVDKSTTTWLIGKNRLSKVDRPPFVKGDRVMLSSTGTVGTVSRIIGLAIGKTNCKIELDNGGNSVYRADFELRRA